MRLDWAAHLRWGDHRRERLILLFFFVFVADLGREGSNAPRRWGNAGLAGGSTGRGPSPFFLFRLAVGQDAGVNHRLRDGASQRLICISYELPRRAREKRKNGFSRIQTVRNVLMHKKNSSTARKKDIESPRIAFSLRKKREKKSVRPTPPARQRVSGVSEQ